MKWHRITILVIDISVCMIANAQFSGQGYGSEKDPYQVTNAAELFEIRNDMSGHFKLMNDIDMSDWTQEENPTYGWSPIGSNNTPFKGVLDGNGHSIIGLYINRPTLSQVGLFGYIDGGTVRNLAFINPIITGQSEVGIVTGYLTGQGYQYGNGNTTGSISDVIVIGGQISGLGDKVGGIVGYAKKASVSGCYCSAKVSGNSSVGGILGEEYGFIYWDGNWYDHGYRSIFVEVLDNHFGGHVTGNFNIGGIVGRMDKPDYYSGETGLHSFTCERNLATGNVSSQADYVGGIAGYMNMNNTDKLGFDASRFSLGHNVAALDTIQSATTEPYRVSSFVTNDNYAKSTMVVMSKGRIMSVVDNSQNGAGFGEKTLKKKSTYEGLGFDFRKVWNIVDNNTYPFSIKQSLPATDLKFTSGSKSVLSGKANGNGYVYAFINGQTYKSFVVDNGWSISLGNLSPNTVASVAIKTNGLIPSILTKVVAQEKQGDDAPVNHGDANNDGTIDSADVTAIINYLLGKPSASFNKLNADINDDGNILIDDAVKTVQLIMNAQ